MTYIAYSLFALGCLVSVVNFYLSFLRYPIFRLRGGVRDDYHWISGMPLIGSLLIVLTLGFVAADLWLQYLGFVCAILDTGGLHWCAGTMFYMACRGKT